jgi:predicted alpha-1,6-mannanase (GH76 family)
MAWRQPQLDYKNTPANGPFAILGARLHQVTGAQVFLDYATQAFDWITETLRDQDGFVEDGINRLGDGKIDTQWRFTYNQGLYIGAGAALAAATGQTTYLDQVGPTVHAALSRLTDGPVFAVEGDGGDEGLFKGIFYRYAATYLQARPDLALAGFIGASTQTLWLHGLSDGGVFEPGTDWCQPPAGPTPYSAHLSAIMATEAMAALMS